MTKSHIVGHLTIAVLVLKATLEITNTLPCIR